MKYLAIPFVAGLITFAALFQSMSSWACRPENAISDDDNFAVLSTEDERVSSISRKFILAPVVKIR